MLKILLIIWVQQTSNLGGENVYIQIFHYPLIANIINY